MYRLSLSHASAENLQGFFERVAKAIADTPDCTPLVHLFSDTGDRAVTDRAIDMLRANISGCRFVGCSTSGNICDGAFVDEETPNLTVFCDIYEHPSTQVEVLQFTLDEAHREETTTSFLKELEERPWVKAVEMLTTIIDVDMHAFCAELSRARDDIVFFGGGALSRETTDMFQGLPYVFSSTWQSEGHAVAFVLYGGSDFHITTQVVSGWNQLGNYLNVTKAAGSIVYELDGAPAYERYHHYLRIERDDSFADNSLLFPLVFDHAGNTVVKAPLKVGEDGSLTLTSTVGAEDKRCRLAYGDPANIMRSIKESARLVSAFAPQAIFSFSCAGRFSYWGGDFVSRETTPFQPIAPTMGFYTGGEFLRQNGSVIQHNLMLVIAGVREGDAVQADRNDIDMDEAEFDRQMAIVSKLAAFVAVTSSELEAAYYRMKVLAVTDGLTGLLNRGEIEKRIDAAMQVFEEGPEPPEAELRNVPGPCVIMIDLDNFKRINDFYGHKAGDDVLKGVGALLKRVIDKQELGWSGRWGGEEFMALLSNSTEAQALEIAKDIRAQFARIDFPLSGMHTLSAGVAEALPNETTDLICQRVDKALYAAKKKGKNCVVVA